MGGNKMQAIILQPRDYTMFDALAVMRKADREQLKLIGGFNSTTAINIRLLKLVRNGFLNVFFTGSVANGRKANYTLTPKSARLIGVTSGILRRSTRTTITGDLFLAHLEHLNDIYVWLRYRPKPRPDIELRRWDITVAPLAAKPRIVPDAYIEWTVGNVVRPHFLEVDLGTEKHEIVLAKVRAYVQFAVSGEFKRRYGHDHFRVLLVFTSAQRTKTLTEEIARITTKIFWLTDFSTINRGGFWGSVWRRPGASELLPLI